MKRKDLAEWIEALKTAKKGVERLKKLDGSMCCLGVLCEMHPELITLKEER